MTQLTDDMIVHSLKGGGIAGLVFGVIFLIVGVILIISMIRTSRKNDERERNGEEPKKNAGFGVSIRSLFGVLFLVWGVCAFVAGVRSLGAMDDFKVYHETVTGKDFRMVKSSSSKKSTTKYFVTYSTLGETKVTSGTYDDVEVGDEFIIVTSKDNDIRKTYEVSEYEYVGAHSVN